MAADDQGVVNQDQRMDISVNLARLLYWEELSVEAFSRNLGGSKKRRLNPESQPVRLSSAVTLWRFSMVNWLRHHEADGLLGEL